MDLYSPVWILVTVVTVFAFASLPVFGRAGFEAATPRVRSIDGLRGLLALAVVLHHAVIYAQVINGDGWGAPFSDLYNWLGAFGVEFFFMITGFLFWNMIVRRDGALDFVALVIGRLFRIGPLYFIALAIGTLLTLLYFREDLVEPRELVSRMAQSSLAGIMPFVPLSDRSENILAGVTWTLQYEWLFYSSLPLLAASLRLLRHQLAVSLIAVLFALTWAFVSRQQIPQLCCLFAFGMLAGSINQIRPPSPSFGRNAAMSALAILAIGISAIAPFDPYAVERILPLGLAFGCFARRADLFGLLNCRPAVRLGEISYGLYILQGPVLFIVFIMVGLQRYMPFEASVSHWLCTVVACLVLAAVSLAAHIFVERPAYNYGKFIAQVPLAPRLATS